MFTAIPIQFILYLYKAATFQSPEAGRLIEVGLYIKFYLYTSRFIYVYIKFHYRC